LINKVIKYSLKYDFKVSKSKKYILDLLVCICLILVLNLDAIIAQGLITQDRIKSDSLELKQNDTLQLAKTVKPNTLQIWRFFLSKIQIQFWKLCGNSIRKTL
jgi:hypothetical protein